MNTRKQFLRDGFGLAAILSSQTAPAILVRSMVAARNCIAATKSLSAKSYVQDGLSVQWDGIENAGYGIHDSYTTIWKDLIGTHDAEQRVGSGWTWSDDSYIGEAASGQGFLVDTGINSMFVDNISNMTVEVVFKPNRNRRMTIFGQYNGIGLNIEYYTNGYSYRIYYNARPDTGYSGLWSDGLKRRIISYTASESGIRVIPYGFTQYMKYYVLDSNTIGPANFIIGGEYSRDNMSIDGEINSIRIYTRVLSDREISFNQMIDCRRFCYK